MVLPGAGDVRYLKAHPAFDPRNAARADHRAQRPRGAAGARGHDAGPRGAGGRHRRARRRHPGHGHTGSRWRLRPARPPRSPPPTRPPRRLPRLPWCPRSPNRPRRLCRRARRAAGRAQDRAALRRLPGPTRDRGRQGDLDRHGARRGAKERAATQQREDLEVTAKRGTIFDRNGLELAVSEDAVTVFANPFLIKNPGKVAASWRRSCSSPRTACCEAHRPQRGFVYLRRKMDRGPARRSKAQDRRHRHDGASRKRSYPQGGWRRRCSARSAPTTTASPGWRLADKGLHGADGQAAGS